MRTTLYPLLDSLAVTLDVPEPIVEFGAKRATAQRHLPDVADSFPGKRYIGSDIHVGQGVDVLLDLHSLGLRDESIGTVLLLDTVEHVAEPWKAMPEILRCLKPGGLLIMTSVFFFPIHDHPSDYWRFTEPGFEVLLRPFDLVATGAAGHAEFPHMVLGLAAKHPFSPDEWRSLVASANRWLDGPATSWKERSMLALPPWLLLAGYRGFRTMTTRGERLRNGK